MLASRRSVGRGAFSIRPTRCRSRRFRTTSWAGPASRSSRSRWSHLRVPLAIESGCIVPLLVSGCMAGELGTAFHSCYRPVVQARLCSLGDRTNFRIARKAQSVTGSLRRRFHADRAALTPLAPLRWSKYLLRLNRCSRGPAGQSSRVASASTQTPVTNVGWKRLSFLER